MDGMGYFCYFGRFTCEKVCVQDCASYKKSPPRPKKNTSALTQWVVNFAQNLKIKTQLFYLVGFCNPYLKQYLSDWIIFPPIFEA